MGNEGLPLHTFQRSIVVAVVGPARSKIGGFLSTTLTGASSISDLELTYQPYGFARSFKADLDRAVKYLRDCGLAWSCYSNNRIKRCWQK